MLPSRIFFDNFLDDMEHEMEPKKLNKMMRCDIYEENNNRSYSRSSSYNCSYVNCTGC